MKPVTYIKKHSPCSEGAEFALKFEHMKDVWDNCTQAGWLCSMAARSSRVALQASDLQRLLARISGLTARNSAEDSYVALIKEIIPNPFK